MQTGHFFRLKGTNETGFYLNNPEKAHMRFSVAPNQQKPGNCKAFRNRRLLFDTKVDANQNFKFFGLSQAWSVYGCITL